MYTGFWLMVALVGVAAGLMGVNYLTGGRLGRFVNTLFTGLGMKLEAAEDPIAGLQTAVDTMTRQTGAATKGLIEGEALADELTRRIADRRVSMAEYENMAMRLDTKAERTAEEDRVLRDYLTRLQREIAQQTEDEASLARQVADNAAFATQLQDAAETIENLNRQARELGVQLHMSEAREKTAAARLRFNTTGLAGCNAAANRYIEAAKTRIARSGATSKVADLLEGEDMRITRDRRNNAGAAMLENLREKWKKEAVTSK